jgi:hypothetical protein
MCNAPHPPQKKTKDFSIVHIGDDPSKGEKMRGQSLLEEGTLRGARFRIV